jgi:hypothetical protein
MEASAKQHSCGSKPFFIHFLPQHLSFSEKPLHALAMQEVDFSLLVLKSDTFYNSLL